MKRAAVLRGREDVRVECVPILPLDEGEVRIAIEAALTCGTDLKVFKRGYHAKMIVPPAVFGHELAGTIAELSDDAAELGWKRGERVVVANSAPCGKCFYCCNAQEFLCDDLLFLNGAYAESIVVPARIVRRNMYRLKSTTSFRDAALTEPLACVVQGIEESQLRPGQRVLVIGAGPIGLMFVSLARHLDCAVSVAGRGEARLKVARKLGADHVIDVGRKADLIETVRAAHAGEFDVVIEAVGKPETWEAAVQLVRKGGLVNLFGGCPTKTTITLDTGRMHYSSLKLIASFHHTPRSVRRALDYIEAGVIKAANFVDAECALTELPDLFKSMTAGNRFVKTLVHVGR